MNIDAAIDNLKQGKILTEQEVRECCQILKQILIEEPNVRPVDAPAVVCGDIHGQFFDLLELFRITKKRPDTNFVFIGDFVDRGHNSVETWEYLMLLKIKFPEQLTLLRGNHESRIITATYGFLDEIIRKYGNSNPWNHCIEVFDLLPLGALVRGSADGDVFCVHGGLSPDLRTIDQIRALDRNIEIPQTGPFCDLMWSDPENIETWMQSTRGAGYLFGSRATKEFNQINGLRLVARAHQLVNEGYQYWFPNNILVTVWSAPNYCYRCGNLAAIMELSGSLEANFKTFKEVEESAKQPNPKNVLPYFL